MGNSFRLSPGYNPHSLQKQARKWPVLACGNEGNDINSDLAAHFNLVWSSVPLATSFLPASGVASDLIDEFGLDAARLALISSQGRAVTLELLESAFKWLAKIYESFFRSARTAFSPQVWLEAALQSRDHVLCRRKPHSGLACIRHAARLSPAGSNLDKREKALVALSVFPFAPILSFALLKHFETECRLEELLQQFDELIAVRYRLEGGGFHWAVFRRGTFTEDPLAAFLALKQVKKACAEKTPILNKCLNDWLICLT